MTDELSSIPKSINQVAPYPCDYIHGSDAVSVELLSQSGYIRISKNNSNNKIYLNASGAEQLAKSLLFVLEEWRLK